VYWIRDELLFFASHIKTELVWKAVGPGIIKGLLNVYVFPKVEGNKISSAA
jgi:hypothetical protein